jgi:hypothetical protein
MGMAEAACFVSAGILAVAHLLLNRPAAPGAETPDPDAPPARPPRRRKPPSRPR